MTGLQGPMTDQAAPQHIAGARIQPGAVINRSRQGKGSRAGPTSEKGEYVN